MQLGSSQLPARLVRRRDVEPTSRVGSDPLPDWDSTTFCILVRTIATPQMPCVDETDIGPAQFPIRSYGAREIRQKDGRTVHSHLGR